MEELRDKGFKTTEYLPHGIDLNVFSDVYKSDTWKKSLDIEGKKVILFVGRLVWEKDLRTFAEIYDLLTNIRNDISFVIVGDGPIRRDLKKLMPEALFLGHKSGIELSTIFASSDLFVFPSTTETFGNVVLESMASGLVPVCSDEGGASNSIKHNQNGIVCKAKDSIDFSKQIISLLKDEERLKMLSVNCIDYASKQSWENIFSQQYQHYINVIENHKLNFFTIPSDSEIELVK